MKMILPYFENSFGINIFPLISMFIFIGMFVWLLVWVIKTDKNYIITMKNLPVENPDADPTGIEKV